MTVELYATDGSRIGTGEIPDQSTYPPAVAEFKQGGPPLFFLHRDGRTYDAYNVPAVKLNMENL